MDQCTDLELAESLFNSAVKAEGEKLLDSALSLFQQAIECFIQFVNCEFLGNGKKTFRFTNNVFRRYNI